MSISVQWDNDNQNVIRYDFSGRWDWDSYERALEQGFAMTEGVEHEVHMLIHLQRGATLPEGAMIYLKDTLAALPANQGLVVVAGGDKSARTTIAMFKRINKGLGKRLAVANDLKEARSLLEVVHRANSLRATPAFINV